MYCSKSVEPKLESQCTLALTGYSCNDFPSRTIESCLTMRRGKTRPNTQSEIP